MDIGSAVSRNDGVSERQLKELADFERSDAFTELERAVLRFATHLTLTPADVPDDETLRRGHIGNGQVEIAAHVEHMVVVAHEAVPGQQSDLLGVVVAGAGQEQALVVAFLQQLAAARLAPSQHLFIKRRVAAEPRVDLPFEHIRRREPGEGA